MKRYVQAGSVTPRGFPTGAGTLVDARPSERADLVTLYKVLGGGVKASPPGSCYLAPIGQISTRLK